jgi:hypothetical protein
MTARARRTLSTAAVTAVTATLALAAVPGPPATGAPSERRAACDAFADPVVDDTVPTAAEVLGISLGDRDVTVAESDRYLRAVSDASPKVVDGVLGRSWNGRPLRYAVVGKPAWTTPAALGRIGRSLEALRDADTPAARAGRLAASTPAVLWVAGNVHGGEESGTDAALRVLYELAARTDCTAQTILDKAVVVVLPTQNPDGREADTRRNAYGFDLNRDWFARTQPETDGKVDMLRRLPPQLFIDAHEMGSEGYFFPPNADPVYHDIGETPLSWIYDLYGPTMQQAFQRFGYPYFNGSFYDLFYMGYGDTVPATGFNAAGMTYEKNSAEPAADRVQHQYTAIWSTLMAAGARHSLLSEWRAEHVKAARQGRQGRLEPNQLYWEGAEIDNPVPDRRVRHYFLLSGDPDKAEELQRIVARLRAMDVDVYRLSRALRVPDFRAYGRAPRAVTLPAGTYWVPMAQGQKHWVQAMLNEDTYVPFPYFYDVTAFSQPLLANVAGGSSGAVLAPRARAVTGTPQVRRPPPAARRAGAPTVGLWQISETSGSSIESAGWLRYFLDRRLGLLYDDLTAADIAGGGLDSLDVLVVPNGDAETASQTLGDAGRQALVQWVRAGGTLVMLRDSAVLANQLGLTTAVYAAPTSDIPGALVRVEVDPESPLADGVGRTAWAMYEYDYVWATPYGDAVPVRYPGPGDEDWFVSGFAEGSGQLRGNAAVVDEADGEGRVVLFGFDPNYRAFTDGTAKMLSNAIVGPRPDDPFQVVSPRRVRPADAAEPASDRMVLSVRAGAADEVRGLLAGYGARADVVRAGNRVGFRVDLGGRPADEHPWARDLADDVAALDDRVVAIRLP